MSPPDAKRLPWLTCWLLVLFGRSDLASRSGVALCAAT